MSDFWRDEDGQDVVEYSLIVVAIALVCLALTGFGQPAVSGIWQVNNNLLSSAAQASAGG
jgi:Flp pilus assembly pilin Flp